MDPLGLKDRQHFAKTYLQPGLHAGLMETTRPSHTIDRPTSGTAFRSFNGGYLWKRLNADGRLDTESKRVVIVVPEGLSQHPVICLKPDY